MSTALQILLTIAGIAVAGVLLAVIWSRVQRWVGVRADDRPREDPDLQLHQAESRGHTRGTGFGI